MRSCITELIFFAIKAHTKFEDAHINITTLANVPKEVNGNFYVINHKHKYFLRMFMIFYIF